MIIMLCDTICADTKEDVSIVSSLRPGGKVAEVLALCIRMYRQHFSCVGGASGVQGAGAANVPVPAPATSKPGNASKKGVVQ